MAKRQQSDRVCVLPGDPTWIETAGYLEDAFDLLGGATEVAEERDHADRFVLTGITYRIAEGMIGRIKADILAPDAWRTTVRLMVIPAFELDALWAVLEVLRRARDGEAGAAEVQQLLDGFGECLSPSRTAAAFTADLEMALAVLTLDIPAGRDLAAAFALDQAPGFDFDAAYAQLAAAWRNAGVAP